MVIANFREYTAVLRDVYSRDAMGEIGAYYQALTNSGEELKQQKLKLLEQIGARKREIDRQAQLIRTTTDKKAAGLRLARIKKQKQDMIRALKVLQNGDHFNVLSDEAKTGVCSGFLLQKYLTRELLEHNPLNFAKDANGNLLVDTERLKHSAIFQEAVHLRDFVAAYMAKYPDKVKTPGHFKTLLNNVKDWRGVLEYADAFFARLNDDAHLTDDMIKASRQGVEVIRVFPGKNVQLVRLRTVEALDYETARMDHCVGKGSYDAAVLNGNLFAAGFKRGKRMAAARNHRVQGRRNHSGQGIQKQGNRPAVLSRNQGKRFCRLRQRRHCRTAPAGQSPRLAKLGICH